MVKCLFIIIVVLFFKSQFWICKKMHEIVLGSWTNNYHQVFPVLSLRLKERETLVQYLTQLCKLMEHCKFRDNFKGALRDRLVCRMLKVPIQKRLFAEKDLNLQKTIEIAQSMEAATKQSKWTPYIQWICTCKPIYNH